MAVDGQVGGSGDEYHVLRADRQTDRQAGIRTYGHVEREREREREIEKVKGGGDCVPCTSCGRCSGRGARRRSPAGSPRGCRTWFAVQSLGCTAEDFAFGRMWCQQVELVKSVTSPRASRICKAKICVAEKKEGARAREREKWGGKGADLVMERERERKRESTD